MKAKHRLVIIGVVAVACIIVLIVVGHWLGWETGFGPEDTLPKQHAKTLWDWLQLLIIPAVLAVGFFQRNLSWSRAWSAAWWRITDVDQEFLSRSREAQPTKICLKRDAIQWFGHDLLPGAVFSTVSPPKDMPVPVVASRAWFLPEGEGKL